MSSNFRPTARFVSLGGITREAYEKFASFDIPVFLVTVEAFIPVTVENLFELPKESSNIAVVVGPEPEQVYVFDDFNAAVAHYGDTVDYFDQTFWSNQKPNA